MKRRTIAYSVTKENLVPVKYAITVHIQAGHETESIRGHSANSLSTAKEIVKRIGEYEGIPSTHIQESKSLGLPKFEYQVS